MTTRWYGWSRCLASILLLAGCAHRVGWPEVRVPLAPLSLAPCSVEGVQGQVACGTLEVPEDWGSSQGRRIALRVMVLKATGSAPAAEPVFVLTGGPGQSALDDAADFAGALARTRQRRDLVLVDQRGTGRSNPLRCDSDESAEGEPLLRKMARDCLEHLRGSADVRFYTTPYAAEDLEAVRRALGAERIDLDGGSYGTRLALVYMRRHPERVRSAVLRGISPPDFRNPLPFPRAGQDALDRLLATCAADAKCQHAFPDVREEFQRVLAGLEKAPVDVVLNPDNGAAPRTLHMTRDRFARLVHLVLFVPNLANHLPSLIHGAGQGNLEPFARLAIAFEEALRDRIYYGMQLAVVCPEDIARITPEDIARETPGTFLGDQLIRDYQLICSEWPRAPLPEDYWELTTLSVPALLLSGDQDPATPPRFGEEVARHLPSSRHIIRPGATHIQRTECVERVVSDFIAAGSATGLDAQCLAEPYRWEFFVPEEAASGR